MKKTPKAASRVTTKYTSKSEQETHEIALKVLKNMPSGAVLCLYGQLGAGKTTFSKGIGMAFGIEALKMKSPTYTYIREIEHDGKKIFHCDFYRLEGKSHAASEMLTQLQEQPHDLIIIEWPEFLEEKIPSHRTDVHLHVKGEFTREISVTHHVKK